METIIKRTKEVIDHVDSLISGPTDVKYALLIQQKKYLEDIKNSVLSNSKIKEIDMVLLRFVFNNAIKKDVSGINEIQFTGYMTREFVLMLQDVFVDTVRTLELGSRNGSFTDIDKFIFQSVEKYLNNIEVNDQKNYLNCFFTSLTKQLDERIKKSLSL